MLKPRVIPCLLLKDRGLVKTVKFKDPKYVGDPINAVKIFNDKEVDELIILDIAATVESRKPDFKLVADIAAEAFVPFSYGGGIRDLNDVNKLLSLGAEKIVINTYAVENPSFIRQLSKVIGSQSIIVSIDVKRGLFGKYEVFIRGGRKATKLNPVLFAQKMEAMGAGELFINSIDKDGTMTGYDIALIDKITKATSIPVVACGGAGKVEDFTRVVKNGGASAAAAGSIFVFHGRHRAVLISYPSVAELDKVFYNFEK